MKAGVSWLARFGLISVIALQTAGCAHSGSGSGGSGGGGGTTPGDTSLIGNWQFDVTSTDNIPFIGLSGFINEQGMQGGSTVTTASLQVQSTSCFANTGVIDLEGFSMSPTAQLTSFPSDSQVVTLGLSQQCTGVQLCGTYTVAGGCADKATGNIVGTKYAQLTGTFSTAASASAALQIMLNQSAQGTGAGNFQVSGSMTFSGLSCATSATIDPTQSYVSGSSLFLVAKTNAVSGAPVTMNATINSAATTLALNNITFTDNMCFQPLTGLNLSKNQ